MKISPDEGNSKPPIMRNVVVLPQPEGPNSVKNSPWRTSSEMPSTARTSPKVLKTSRNSMLGRPKSRERGGAESLTAVCAIIGVSSSSLAAEGCLLRKPVREKHAGERHPDNDGRRRVDLRRD